MKKSRFIPFLYAPCPPPHRSGQCPEASQILDVAAGFYGSYPLTADQKGLRSPRMTGGFPEVVQRFKT